MEVQETALIDGCQDIPPKSEGYNSTHFRPSSLPHSTTIELVRLAHQLGQLPVAEQANKQSISSRKQEKQLGEAVTRDICA